jgi:hypothetical protein
MGLLERAGYCAAPIVPPAPRLADLGSDGRARADDAYRRLGGVLADPTFRPGAWDLALAGGIVVELDEDLHFNRYRGLTLDADWSVELPWQHDYSSLVVEYEAECLAAGKWGKRWTNPSCERMFGIADSPGTFATAGAPRWKQRALYDAIKDIAALERSGPQVARLSVFDLVGEVRLEHALRGRSEVDLDALRELLVNRTT